ncbi:hypothetical protein CERSUDRAFT_98364 [Gelatoporia subvermispora B]|uniref:Uncharacterized protein n=1 Tax=Ceriporiopsis subvermispora (strain B) TaxID=914234 RepID=M2R6J1_CERS8|nr:hypothetical protein CERSUDRAFT_98364 [Gelatoporia subvermispora B]
MSSKNPTHDGNTSHFAIASGGSGTMAPMGESSHDYSTSSHMGYDNHHTFENAPYAQDWQVYHALSRMNDAGQLPSLPISFLDFTELRGHGLSLMDPYPILSANFGFHSTDNVAERTFRDTQESNGYLLLWGADTTPDESLSGSPFETEHAQCDANQKQGIKGTGAASTPCDSEALCGHSTHHEEDAPTAVPDWDACSTVDTTSSTSYTGPESAPVILNNLQSSRTVADGRWLPREAGEVTALREEAYRVRTKWSQPRQQIYSSL